MLPKKTWKRRASENPTTKIYLKNISMTENVGNVRERRGSRKGHKMQSKGWPIVVYSGDD